MHLNAYNAYQSTIRGGHTFLTIRTRPDKVSNIGDGVDLLIPLNQDAIDRHLKLLTDGAACVYNSDTIRQGVAAEGVQLCPLPIAQLADITRNKLAQNTLSVGAGLSMMGIGFQALEGVLAEQFKKKGDSAVFENIEIARAGYDYAAANFKPFAWPLPMTGNRYAVLSGNTAMAIGGAAAGVKFYCAYPMSPSTGVLALDGGQRSQSRDYGPAGGRQDWCSEYGDRGGPCLRSFLVRYLWRRLCINERGPRPLSHDGNSRGSNRLPTGWPIYRRSHQDRARRSLAKCWALLSGTILV